MARAAPAGLSCWAVACIRLAATEECEAILRVDDDEAAARDERGAADVAGERLALALAVTLRDMSRRMATGGRESGDQEASWEMLFDVLDDAVCRRKQTILPAP